MYATQNQIKAAYIKKASLYHPDKLRANAEEDDKENLGNTFCDLNKAYNILQNKVYRDFYDAFGFEPLVKAQSSLQFTKNDKDLKIEDMLKAYAKHEANAYDEMLFSKVNPSGIFKLKLDAQDIFDPISEIEDTALDSNIQVRSISLHQAMDFQPFPRLNINLGGRVYNEEGHAFHSILINSTYKFSNDINFEAKLNTFKNQFTFSSTKTLISGHILQATANFFGPISKTAPQITLFTSLNLLDNFKVAFGFTFTRELCQLSNELDYSYEHQKVNSTLIAVTTIGPLPSFSLTCVNEIKEMKLNVVNTMKYSKLASSYAFQLEKEINDYSKIFSKFSIKSLPKISASFGISRGRYKYVLPINLCEKIIPRPIAYGFLATMAFIEGTSLILNYFNDQNEEDDDEEMKKQKMDEALVYQEKMKSTYLNKLKQESEEYGLMIQRAYYGPVALKNGSIDGISESIDISIPLQLLVEDHQLQIANDVDIKSLDGIYDPCPKQKKKLMIRYIFLEKPHMVLFDESESILIPQESHAL